MIYAEMFFFTGATEETVNFIAFERTLLYIRIVLFYMTL